MEYRKLGRTGLDVSEICLGTMTWGQQNTEQDGFAQMDYALDQGINFFDTAELYSIPGRAETQGSTETIIGNWFEKTGNRDKIILATKIVGGSGMKWFREGGEPTRLTRKQIQYAVDQSLKRLKTDYIDLYQLHWPDRSTNFFSKLGYVATDNEPLYTDMQETLEALDEIVKAGKVRHVGCSNESAWGAMKYLSLSDAHNLPRMQSIQNPYSLLTRQFEVGLAEVAHREDLGLLAYSPLGFGTLSGKYLDENGEMKADLPEGARITLFPDYARYTKPQGIKATAAYVKLAKDNGLDPSQMALAYVLSKPFVTSCIIGATSMEQLKINIGAKDVTLSDEVMKEIEKIHTIYTYPAP